MKTIFNILCLRIAIKCAYQTSNKSTQLGNILAEVNVQEEQTINKKSYVSQEEVDVQLLQ